MVYLSKFGFPAIETAVVAIGLPLIETDAPVSVTMFSPPL
jgi:hypothetical protein